MDDFPLEYELSGTLLTLEFGPAGRIRALWGSDPSLPDEGEDFQFVLGSASFGEELADDYHPGTILLGARTSDSEPWVVGRSTTAEVLNDSSELIELEYEIGLLPDLRVTGKYYEVPGVVPQVCWDVRVANVGKRSVEIGELAFPFALQNLYEGYGRTEQRAQDLWNDRVVVHKCISGASSWLFAQRLSAEPPGLLICPGDDTEWEFYTHAAASIQAPYSWAGIPIIYIHSVASVEREGWNEWANGHTSLILEPGDARTYQTRFTATDRDRFDTLHQTLQEIGRPVARLLPGAAAPVEVGIAIEVGGCRPMEFSASVPCHMDSDSDEEGGFCFVQPSEPGPVRITFKDSLGRTSHVHALFTPSIESLIRRRADWILANQFLDRPGSPLHRSILMASPRTGAKIETELGTPPFFIEAGLADALFLAEKNSIYPEPDQIRALDSLIDQFLLDDLQNPGDYAVGSSFVDPGAVAVSYARPQIYPLVFNFYHSMARIASSFGGTARLSAEYLRMAASTALAMMRRGFPRSSRTVGFPGYARIFDLLSDLSAEGMTAEFEALMPFVSLRAEDLMKQPFPYLTDGIPDPGSFVEAYTAARHLNDERRQEQALRLAFAGRSLSPSWWWYGSDMRIWQPGVNGALPIPYDHGELCQGGSGPENSQMMFDSLDRDYGLIPEAYLRLAFGGMLGVWSLVQPDGSASMAYCPDSASRLQGFTGVTGDVGHALYSYLRSAASYVLPSWNYGVVTFGCHFEMSETEYTVRPWDGVGRRVILRQIGVDYEVSAARIKELKLDLRKRWTRLTLENPSSQEGRAHIKIHGLWGRRFRVMGEPVEAQDGNLAVGISLPANGVRQIEILAEE